jgi:hypothetical protein
MVREVVVRAGETIQDASERSILGLEHLPTETWKAYRKVAFTLQRTHDRARDLRNELASLEGRRAAIPRVDLPEYRGAAIRRLTARVQDGVQLSEVEPALPRVSLEMPRTPDLLVGDAGERLGQASDVFMNGVIAAAGGVPGAAVVFVPELAREAERAHRAVKRDWDVFIRKVSYCFGSDDDIECGYDTAPECGNDRQSNFVQSVCYSRKARELERAQIPLRARRAEIWDALRVAVQGKIDAAKSELEPFSFVEPTR